MPNPTMPFTPSDLLTAKKITAFAIGSECFNMIMPPVLDQLVELYPRGEGYDPEEVYMHYLVPAADAMFGYRTVMGMAVLDQHFHMVKSALARMLEYSYRVEVLGAVKFDCDREIGVLG
jgi:hypothetical protein